MILATSLLFHCWEFVTRHPGLVLVLVGVAGEVACDWKEMSGRLARTKKISAILLVVGLAIEFIEAAKSDEEIAQLSVQAADSNFAAKQAAKDAAEANERAANTQSKNLALEKEVLRLRNPSIITDAQRKKFIEILLDPHNVSKVSIDVIIGDNDRGTERFAFQLRKILDDAGYGNVASKYQVPLEKMDKDSLFVTGEPRHVDLPPFEFYDGVLMKIPNLVVTPSLNGIQRGILKLGKTGLTDAEYISESPFTISEPNVIAVFSGDFNINGPVPHNGSPPPSPSVAIMYPSGNNPSRDRHYVYCPATETNAILYGVCEVLHEIGITVGKSTNNAFLPPGHVGFFIPRR